MDLLSFEQFRYFKKGYDLGVEPTPNKAHFYKVCYQWALESWAFLGLTGPFKDKNM